MDTRQRGFTLIEVLAAFLIAASSLALLFRIQANSNRTLVMAEEYLVATELAKSLVDELSVTGSALAFERSGRLDGKYRWYVRADEYSSQTASPSPADEDVQPPLTLRSLAVTIRWDSGSRSERFELRTVRPFIPSETDVPESP